MKLKASLTAMGGYGASFFVRDRKMQARQNLQADLNNLSTSIDMLADARCSTTLLSLAVPFAGIVPTFGHVWGVVP